MTVRGSIKHKVVPAVTQGRIMTRRLQHVAICTMDYGTSSNLLNIT